MASAGDIYTVQLNSHSHLGWGNYRNTSTRDFRPGEAYIPIPRQYAIKFQILNSNGTSGENVLGKNIFRCTSADGRFHGVLKAEGSQCAGDIYAKQFAGNGNLKAVGDWYSSCGIEYGDTIQVRWVSAYDILIEKI